MPKEIKKSSSSSSSKTPYSREGSNPPEKKEVLRFLDSKCSICLEPPHNSVMIVCASVHCKPYMCNTSDLLSNCFEEFCRRHFVTPINGRFDGDKDSLLCPLCRAQILGWVVVEPARESMNKMVRNCSLNWCDFSGNYEELVKHAEKEHPAAKPREEEEVLDEKDDDDDQVEDGDDDDDEVEDGDEDDDEAEEDDDDDDDEEGYKEELRIIKRYRLEMGDEGPWEVQAERLKPGETFEDHIHFGGPNEKMVSEKVTYSGGSVNYERTTDAGKTYYYSGPVGEVDIDKIRAR